MCEEETMDTRNAFWYLVKKLEDRRQMENAAEIKPVIRMGNKLIYYVALDWTGSCGKKCVSSCISTQSVMEKVDNENKMLILKKPYCVLLVKLVIFMKNVLQHLLNFVHKHANVIYVWS
jgi:hypothetical protein